VLARLHLPRWWWLSLQAGVLFGVAFVHWLFFQSLYRIGALCPYCMVVWVVMIVLFSYTTLYNVQVGRLPAPTGAPVLPTGPARYIDSSGTSPSAGTSPGGANRAT